MTKEVPGTGCLPLDCPSHTGSSNACIQGVKNVCLDVRKRLAGRGWSSENRHHLRRRFGFLVEKSYPGIQIDTGNRLSVPENPRSDVPEPFENVSEEVLAGSLVPVHGFGAPEVTSATN